MFIKLRNRFLILLMVTVTVLMLLFFSTILAISWQDAEQKSVNLLEKNLHLYEKDQLDQSLAEPNRFSAIFAIDVGENGAVTAIHSTFNLEDEVYRELVTAVEEDGEDAKGAGEAHYGDYTFKYKELPTEEGSRIVFMDVSRDAQMISGMVRSFLWMALPLLGLIFIICKYFADRAIKPIRESFERQNQFIADASHELKTPLAAICTNASVLTEDATEEQKKWIGFIKEETRRLEKLTSSLLYLSREPKGKKELSRCSFTEAAERILMPLEAVFYEKEIDCDNQIDQSLFVIASEEQLERLINILIENAIKYAESRVSVALRRENKSAILSVSNDGIGIPPEDLDRIWDRFYRSDKARLHKGGFGLGLSMAKSIVTELKGTIRVSSKPGGETMFTVVIPLA